MNRKDDFFLHHSSFIVHHFIYREGDNLLTTTTVLLDLDNTLLGNNMDDFLPPYFAGLRGHLHKFVDSRDLQRMMIASVQVMRANQDPNVTNMTAFMTDFARRIGFPIETIQPAIDAFYREDYPQLEQFTNKVVWPTFWPRYEAGYCGQKIAYTVNQESINAPPLVHPVTNQRLTKYLFAVIIPHSISLI